jgi:hypothetical protein
MTRKARVRDVKTALATGKELREETKRKVHKAKNKIARSNAKLALEVQEAAVESLKEYKNILENQSG